MPVRFVFALLLAVVWLLLTAPGQQARAQAQTAPAERIANVRLTALNQTSLEILYDLSVSLPGDSIHFEVIGRKRGSLTFNSGFIEGDFGRHVSAGPNKRILWNVIANGYELNEEIRVRVLVRPAPANFNPIPTIKTGPTESVRTLSQTPDTTNAVQSRIRRPYRPGGPATALLSVLVPGLGNVFVQGPKPKIGFRPFITAGVAGALVYGFGQRSQAQDQYAMYRLQKNPEAGEPYYQQANDSQHRYYVATRLAAALWLGDVVATFVRGLRNQRQRSAAAPVSLRPGYQSGIPVAALTLRF